MHFTDQPGQRFTRILDKRALRKITILQHSKKLY